MYIDFYGSFHWVLTNGMIETNFGTDSVIFMKKRRVGMVQSKCG